MGTHAHTHPHTHICIGVCPSRWEGDQQIPSICRCMYPLPLSFQPHGTLQLRRTYLVSTDHNNKAGHILIWISQVASHFQEPRAQGFKRGPISHIIRKKSPMGSGIKFISNLSCKGIGTYQGMQLILSTLQRNQHSFCPGCTLHNGVRKSYDV